MSASNVPSGRAAAENELLARMGLPPSASAEDVDQLHLAVSQFLAAAPSSIRGWAHAQAASLDEAYLQLTDPVGLEGSALRSPTRPPTVVPGGPATPPARRDPVPAVAAEEADPDDEAPDGEQSFDAPPEPVLASVVDDTDTDDLDALYASVTPGAHRDLVSGGKADRAAATAAPATSTPAAPKAAKAARARAVAAPAEAAPAPDGNGIWKALALIATAGFAVVLIGFVIVPTVFNLGGATANGGDVNAPTAKPSASVAVVDQTRVAALMAQLQAKPDDAATLQAIGDEYFKGEDFANAGTFYDKALAVDPKNASLLLARGASYYNSGDDANAEKTWKSVVDLTGATPSQLQEAHYDLGFLYLNAATPNWAGVQEQWNAVIKIDATTQLAQVVQQHLDSLVKASMIPAPGSSAAPAASGAPVASGSAAPAGSAAPSASVAAIVVNQTATGVAYGSTSLSAPAGAAFTLHFDNQATGIQHDIVIKDAAGATVFKGDLITGPSAVDYQVPALAAGTYTFGCSIHPIMVGTLVAGN